MMTPSLSSGAAITTAAGTTIVTSTAETVAVTAITGGTILGLSIFAPGVLLAAAYETEAKDLVGSSIEPDLSF